MAGVLNALLVDEHVDVLEVPGRAEAVGVSRLPPLAIGFLVAVAAVLGGIEALGVEELPVGRGGVGGKKWRVFTDGVVVSCGNGIVKSRGGTGDASGGGVGGCVGCGRRRGVIGSGDSPADFYPLSLHEALQI